jgi:TolB-like protein
MARRLGWIAAGCALWVAAFPLSAWAAEATPAPGAAAPSRQPAEAVKATPATKATVAILPIVVHSQADEAYLRDGLADMLASRLGRSPGVSVIRLDDPSKATTDEKVARQSASAVGADWVLFGSFTHFGEGASLDVKCVPVKVDDKVGGRSIFIQSGTLGDIIPRLDSLTGRIARHVTSGGQDEAAPVKVAPEEAATREEVDALRHRVETLEDEVRDVVNQGEKPRAEGGGGRPGARREAR